MATYSSEVDQAHSRGVFWTDAWGVNGPFTAAFEYDASNNPVYIGMAKIGSSKADPVWQIRKLTFDASNNVTDIKWARGSSSFTNVWNDRTFTNVAVDATTAPAALQSVSSITFAHTVGVVSNPYLIVAVYAENNPAPIRTVTSVTYNGVALTKIAEQIDIYVDGFLVTHYTKLDLWALKSPPTGAAHDVVVTLDGVATNLFAAATSFSGADQVAETSLAVSAGTTLSISVSPASDGDMAIDSLASDGYTTVGGGQTERYNTHNPNYGFSGSTKAGPGTPGLTLSWTGSALQRHVAAVIRTASFTYS